MDIYRINTDIKFANQLGLTLSVDEIMKLELAFQQLLEDNKYDQLLFWGKIEGTSKDYYIAMGLVFQGQFEFPTKHFHYCTNDTFEFSILKDLDPTYAQRVDEFRTLFTGVPNKVLIKVAQEENQEENQEAQEGQEQQEQEVDSDDEANKKQQVPNNFTEADRLAYVVRSIENDCALAPIGAFKLTPTHELRYNDTFNGLSLQQNGDLANYQHFRAPQSKEKQEYIARDDALFNFDFLDTLTSDQPKGQWSVQSDSSKTQATVRNLLWPGFLGYHRSNSRIFGYVYIGNGVKNADLPFLL